MTTHLRIRRQSSGCPDIARIELVSRPRSKRGAGPYVAPKGALVPGAVTRLEWLNFLRKVHMGDACQCGNGATHFHWLWIGNLAPDGYGKVTWRGWSYKAHRFACIALGGNIAGTEELDHLCRVRQCCNPACVEPVSHFENMQRAPRSSFPAQQVKRFCKHGHELTPDNLYIRPSGARRCRLCKRRDSNLSKRAIRMALRADQGREN
jgi:hypothetical protein